MPKPKLDAETRAKLEEELESGIGSKKLIVRQHGDAFDDECLKLAAVMKDLQRKGVSLKDLGIDLLFQRQLAMEKAPPSEVKPKLTAPKIARLDAKAAIRLQAEKGIVKADSASCKKPYAVNTSEFKLCGYLRISDRRHARQLLCAPPVSDVKLSYRRIGSPKPPKFAAAIAQVLEHKNDWEAQDPPLHPTEFEELHRPTMYWDRDTTADGKRVPLAKPEMKYMDRGLLGPLEPADGLKVARIHGYLLWWLVQEFENFSALSSDEQRSKYDEVFNTHPWALPRWEDLQLENGKFPVPAWRDKMDTEPEMEALSRAHSLIMLSISVPSTSAPGSSDLSEGSRHLYVKDRHNTFQSAPFNMSLFLPGWMRQPKSTFQQKDQVVKSIAEERPRTIHYRYGDMDEHDTILDLAEQDGEMARYTKAFKKLKIEPTDPDDQVPLDIELDPRNVSEQRCWRDMMREMLGLQDYKATIAQIDVSNDAKKKRYPKTIYHYQNAPEIPWEEFQQFIEDEARHNVIIIILRFPTDPEELNDMEWPGLFSAQQTTFIESLRAKKKTDQDATIESLTASRGETPPAISSDTAISRKRGRGDSGTSTGTAGPSKQKPKTSREWDAVDAGIGDSSGTPSVGRVTTSAKGSGSTASKALSKAPSKRTAAKSMSRRSRFELSDREMIEKSDQESMKDWGLDDSDDGEDLFAKKSALPTASTKSAAGESRRVLGVGSKKDDTPKKRKGRARSSTAQPTGEDDGDGFT